MKAFESQIEDAVVEGELQLADKLAIRFRDFRGPLAKAPILCLHGLTRNGRDFEKFARRYSARRRVIALDFRGRGKSDPDPDFERYTPLTYARDVVELLDALGIEKAIFVGTSLGGLVTMVVAATMPERIAASILNDVGPELTSAGLERIRSYVGKDRRFKSWSDAAQSIAQNNGIAFPSYSNDDWVEMAKRVCREQNGTIRFDYDMAIARPFDSDRAAPSVDLWPLFKALGEKPLLVVRGALSDLLSASTLEEMQDMVPAMRSVTVEGIGHAPMLDEPEALGAIDAFLGSLDV